MPVISARRCWYAENDVRLHHYYWCPGCDCLHGITINPHKNSNGAGWDFTGTLECPTYAPSQLAKHGTTICHTFIRNGLIQYLSDSTHHLSGKTVPLPNLPVWFIHDDKEEASEGQDDSRT